MRNPFLLLAVVATLAIPVHAAAKGKKAKGPVDDPSKVNLPPPMEAKDVVIRDDVSKMNLPPPLEKKEDKKDEKKEEKKEEKKDTKSAEKKKPLETPFGGGEQDTIRQMEYEMELEERAEMERQRLTEERRAQIEKEREDLEREKEVFERKKEFDEERESKLAAEKEQIEKEKEWKKARKNLAQEEKAYAEQVKKFGNNPPPEMLPSPGEVKPADMAKVDAGKDLVKAEAPKVADAQTLAPKPIADEEPPKEYFASGKKGNAPKVNAPPPEDPADLYLPDDMRAFDSPVVPADSGATAVADAAPAKAAAPAAATAAATAAAPAKAAETTTTAARAATADTPSGRRVIEAPAYSPLTDAAKSRIADVPTYSPLTDAAKSRRLAEAPAPYSPVPERARRGAPTEAPSAAVIAAPADAPLDMENPPGWDRDNPPGWERKPPPPERERGRRRNRDLARDESASSTARASYSKQPFSPVNFAVGIDYANTRYPGYAIDSSGTVLNRDSHGFHASFEWIPINDYGKLGLGAGIGYISLPKTSTVVSDSVAINLIPFDAYVVYRFDYLRHQILVPFLKLGTSLLSVSSEVTNPTAGTTTSSSATYIGIDASVGLAVNLRFASARDAGTLDREYGINDVYLVTELLYSKALNKGSAPNLEHRQLRVGLRFEF